MIATIEKLGPHTKDEAGNRFGKWIVLEYVGKDKFDCALWLCRCDCGKEKTVLGSRLRGKYTKHCGCSRVIDEAGNQYGKWTVLEYVGTGNSGEALWRVRCDCGTERDLVGSELRSGHSKSCGCSGVLPKGEAALNALINSIRCSAVKRNYSFELTKEQIRNLVTQSCHYCGSPPTQVSKRKRTNGTFVYNGLDRMDNSLGYVIDNVVPCCKRCNIAKHTMDYQEFRAWVYQTYKHFVEGGAQ